MSWTYTSDLPARALALPSRMPLLFSKISQRTRRHRCALSSCWLIRRPPSYLISLCSEHEAESTLRIGGPQNPNKNELMMLRASWTAARRAATAASPSPLGGSAPRTGALVAATRSAPTAAAAAAAAATLGGHGGAALRANFATTSASTAEEKKKPCWNCSAAVGSAELFCDKCEHLLAPDEEASHFEVLGLEESFDVDIKKLEKDFWSLQKKLHPDRFGYRHETEQDFSAEHSSRVNDAYKVLKSPIDRAIYMLEKRGVTALSEGGSSDVDPAVLMNVMETREELADAETSEELSRLETVARDDEDRLIAQISDAFARDDLETATRAAIELRYATKLREEVEAKRVSQMLLNFEWLTA